MGVLAFNHVFRLEYLTELITDVFGVRWTSEYSVLPHFSFLNIHNSSFE